MEYKKYPGHIFLAKLGKKRLRPGGKVATDWLFDEASFTADKKVLEVACNMGTTAIELATKYDVNITAIDIDKFAVKKAVENVEKENLSDKINIIRADAKKLPFEDNSFDIVVNEAMLTMLTNENKSKCLKEYFRVLKPGGILLTHDVQLKVEDGTREDLSKGINMNVTPLLKEEWIDIIEKEGFTDITFKSGPLTVMTPLGMIYDEGIFGVLKILSNGLKKQYRTQFFSMFKMFKRNRKNMNYIAIASRKL